MTGPRPPRPGACDAERSEAKCRGASSWNRGGWAETPSREASRGARPVRLARPARGRRIADRRHRRGIRRSTVAPVVVAPSPGSGARRTGSASSHGPVGPLRRPFRTDRPPPDPTQGAPDQPERRTRSRNRGAEHRRAGISRRAGESTASVAAGRRPGRGESRRRGALLASSPPSLRDDDFRVLGRATGIALTPRVRSTTASRAVPVRQVRLQEGQDLPDDIARGGAVIHDVEGMRPRGVIDEGHGPIVANGSCQERVERGVQSRRLVTTRAGQE